MAQESERHWGRIAFGVGLVTCVIAGAVVGVMLGSGKDDADRGVLRRVTALALDTRGLNDDALALSRAIEEAIEREELEGEAESLRARLALLEERAARIQARARWRAVSEPGGEHVSDGAEQRWARSGLSEVRSAVAIFDREVVGNLDDALASSSTSTATDALAQATAVAERQSAKMTKLSQNASRVEGPEGGEEPPGEPIHPADASLGIGGGFPIVSSAEGEPLDAEYELAEIEAEAEEAGEAAGGWEVTTSASGTLSIANPVHGPPAAAVSPLLIWLFWEESQLADAARGDARFEPQAEELPSKGVAATPSPACQYELRGRLYCLLAAFRFGEEEEGERATLSSGEEVDLGGATAAGALRIEAGGDAEAVAELIGQERPALVQILGAVPQGLFQPACEPAFGPAEPGEAAGSEGATETTEVTETETTEAEVAVETTEAEAGEAAGGFGETVALLDGDGSAIFEAEKSPKLPAPVCFEVSE